MRPPSTSYTHSISTLPRPSGKLRVTISALAVTSSLTNSSGASAIYPRDAAYFYRLENYNIAGMPID